MALRARPTNESRIPGPTPHVGTEGADHRHEGPRIGPDGADRGENGPRSNHRKNHRAHTPKRADATVMAVSVATFGVARRNIHDERPFGGDQNYHVVGDGRQSPCALPFVLRLSPPATATRPWAVQASNIAVRKERKVPSCIHQSLERVVTINVTGPWIGPKACVCRQNTISTRAAGEVPRDSNRTGDERQYAIIRRKSRATVWTHTVRIGAVRSALRTLRGNGLLHVRRSPAQAPPRMPPLFGHHVTKRGYTLGA